MTGTAAAPLAQDNSLPGNRGGRFSFDHLLFLMVVTPIYLWLELSFGAALLDTIGAQVIDRDTAAIEHWGRLLSGVAVALLALPRYAARCERHGFPWLRRLIGGSGVVLICIAGTWWLQTAVIDFFVMHSQASLVGGLWALGCLCAAVALLLRWQIKAARRSGQSALPRVLAILAIGAGLLRAFVSYGLTPDQDEIRARGIERQRAAYLTVARRALEEDVYRLPAVADDRRFFASAEGKTMLALFPVLGAGLPAQTEALIAERERILFELMLKEWARSYGVNSFDGFREVLAQVRAEMPPTQDWQRYAGLPATRKLLAQRVGCFDCQFRHDMSRAEFERELFARTQSAKVEQLLQRLGDPANFEQGEDGERAARTYWVPIWSLLFSLLGAFTHSFKIIFTFIEYAHRRSFQRLQAADSALAQRVVATSRIATAIVVALAAVLIYFTENRVTGHPRYQDLRPAMWQNHPISAGIVLHWVVNAQGILNPVLRKLRPDWLRFETDPLAPWRQREPEY